MRNANRGGGPDATATRIRPASGEENFTGYATKRHPMFERSAQMQATAADIAEIARRVQGLERRVERALGQTSSGLSQTADWVADALASALGDVADRFRGGARSVSDEAARVGHHAARLGNDAVRRISTEVEERPLVMLAVAAGIGFLLAGMLARRR